MAPVVDAIEKVARTDATVLLLGESGTGKEVAARDASTRGAARGDGPVRGGQLRGARRRRLLESELFGHEKGAFTGADRERGAAGIELADGGTLFLDEVGELQARAAGQAAARAAGAPVRARRRHAATIEVDVRWIAATNRDLGAR